MPEGGKAVGLKRLREGGFAVPSFFVCDESWEIQRILENVTRVLPSARFFAVRSSATSEDSKEQSFAGKFYSGIAVPRQALPSEITKVRASFGAMSGSVIVQEFIPGEISGVMFTQVGQGVVMINSTLGLCGPVVSGDACDEYWCSKNGAVLKRIVSEEKRTQQFRDDVIVSEVSGKESLGEAEVRELVRMGRKIQDFFGSPQDVEWCFRAGRLYILQSRPITRDVHGGLPQYFDSANIAESYSGIVLPLTCSFGQMVYEQVYKDLLRMSGVSRRKIELHSDVFESLLGFFYGRMYYNMNNWYRMAEFVPGYRRNKENFEQMITSNVREVVATTIRPSPMLRILYPLIVSVKVALFGITAAHFRSRVTRRLRLLRQTDFDGLGHAESIKLFESINTHLLRRWYVTLENDFFVMTYLGLLKKQVEEEELQKAIVFPSKATEQISALADLSRRLQEVDELWSAVVTDNVAAFNEGLSHHAEIKSSLMAYLHTFGGRFANELKLESVGVDEDRARLFAVLRAYQGYQAKQPIVQWRSSRPLFRRILIAVTLKKFKKYAARREEFRLLRSNTFAVARRLFRHMGLLLAQKGVLQHPDDVFFLHMEELLDPKAETNQTLQQKVTQRVSEYRSYTEMSPPAHFSTIDGTPPPTKSFDGLGGAVIHARPASPGLVRGKVRVFRTFSMPETVDFDILVTSHTDPGWVPLIALSKGLVIEHGGVLSHASIVARELGIPAVIGATHAVDTLKDDQMIEIDGSTGVIKIL